MTPQRLDPTFREKIWGVTRLAPWFPDSINAVGEVWFEGDLPAPLLTKFLFTSQNLSVQVHPEGKTEMWHILAAEPGAKIAAGFREKVAREDVERAIAGRTLDQMLTWFDAAPGDTFFIPVGTVHAIGAGLTLCEVQQYSDVTFRLYDYGRPRDLHIDEGLAVSDFVPHPARQKPDGDVLVKCPFFTIRRISVEGNLRHRPHAAGFQQLIVIRGSGTINGQPVGAGQVWQIPAGAPEFEISGYLDLLEAHAS